MAKIRFVLAATALFMAVPAAAQAPGSTASCPSGQVTRVRLSTIKPGSTMADFQAAVAAHIAWYKAHGFKIDQRVAPIVAYDPATKQPKQSATEVMTFATGDFVPQEKQDDGWKAFVAKYRAVSDLVIDKPVCMPQAAD